MRLWPGAVPMAVAPAGSPVVVPVACGCAWGHAFGGALCEEKVVSRTRETENSQENDKKTHENQHFVKVVPAHKPVRQKKSSSRLRETCFFCADGFY